MGVSPRSPNKTGVLHLYGELWHFARGKRNQLAWACVLLVGAQIILLAAPLFAAKAINALQLHGAQGLGQAAWSLATVLGLAVLAWVLHGPGRVFERNVALGARRRLATSLIEKLVSLPLGWHEAHHSGATAHRVQQSSQALTSFAQNQYIYLNSFVRLVGPIVALSVIDGALGLSAVAGFAIICTAVLRFDRTMIRLAREENDAERRYAASMVDALGKSTSLLALRQGRGVVALLERRLEAVFTPLKRAIVVNEIKWCTVDLATRALSCVLVGLFAWRAARGAGVTGSAVNAPLMLGSLYMVWEYAMQASGVVASIAQHFQSFARQTADYASADVIREAEASHAPDRATPEHERNWRRLEIRDLTFRHASNRDDAPNLDRLSLTLERGKRYALIGGSGCGKSTLLRVLAGLHSGERGHLKLDSGPVTASPMEVARQLRAHATLIPQDAEVIAGSLAENLSLCESVAGPPRPDLFAHALTVARADRFVDASPAGLELHVAESGANWSGGQRSRIALARGVLAAAGSGLVLLDEPTAHLDGTTESQVYDSVFDHFEDACIVSSLHRLHLLDRFDEVLVMKGGRLVAQGPVEQLAAHSRDFRELIGTAEYIDEATPAAA